MSVQLESILTPHELFLVQQDSPVQDYFINDCLNEKERKLIPHKKDRICFALARLIVNDKERKHTFDIYGPSTKFREHYSQEELKWILTCRYFLGMKIKRDPTPGELNGEVDNLDLNNLYKGFFVLRFPEQCQVIAHSFA